jgi:hypothetical protein
MRMNLHHTTDIAMEQDKDAELKTRLNQETSKLRWTELQRHYAGGNVVVIDEALDLIAVAVAIGSATSRPRHGCRWTWKCGRWWSNRGYWCKGWSGWAACIELEAVASRGSVGWR